MDLAARPSAISILFGPMDGSEHIFGGDE